MSRLSNRLRGGVNKLPASLGGLERQTSWKLCSVLVNTTLPFTVIGEHNVTTSSLTCDSCTLLTFKTCGGN